MSSDEIEKLYASLSLRDHEGPVCRLQDGLKDAGAKKMTLCLGGKLLSPDLINRDAFRSLIARIGEFKRVLTVKTTSHSYKATKKSWGGRFGNQNRRSTKRANNLVDEVHKFKQYNLLNSNGKKSSKVSYMDVSMVDRTLLCDNLGGGSGVRGEILGIDFISNSNNDLGHDLMPIYKEKVVNAVERSANLFETEKSLPNNGKDLMDNSSLCSISVSRPDGEPTLHDDMDRPHTPMPWGGLGVGSIKDCKILDNDCPRLSKNSINILLSNGIGPIGRDNDYQTRIKSSGLIEGRWKIAFRLKPVVGADSLTVVGGGGKRQNSLVDDGFNGDRKKSSDDSAIKSLSTTANSQSASHDVLCIAVTLVLEELMVDTTVVAMSHMAYSIGVV
ncbi:hypothetical protein QYF36_010660 [Acer negundo]|nr:hypothetical protein QYF36_010660 [Acer negundo]